jgi:hypothetical protein
LQNPIIASDEIGELIYFVGLNAFEFAMNNLD